MYNSSSICYQYIVYSIQYTRMNPKSRLWLCLFVIVSSLAGCVCFTELHSEYELMAYFEKYSLKPILHVYYNKHFRNSTRFTDFEKILKGINEDHGDYFDILFTDCDKDAKHELKTCERMRKTKDNRQITGTMPSSQFRKLGTKILIQNPPSTKAMENKGDIYTQSQILDFLTKMLPNFYQLLNNKEQFDDFLEPRYSPKLILFNKEDEDVPTVMKQIATNFFLKIDLAQVSDLTEDIIKQFQIKSELPCFAIMQYDFESKKNQIHYYTESDLTENNYHKIKKFVGRFALQEPRNDLLFHKIHMEEQAEIVTVETEGELQRQKQKANGWCIISYSNGRISEKLAESHQKFGRYFSYINYVHEPIDKIEVFNPSQNQTFPLMDGNLRFNSLNYEDFKSNMTVWLTKDMIVIGTTEDYAHVCGLSEKTLFRGQTRCLIINKEGEEQLKKFMKIDFKVGFIVRIDKKQLKDEQEQRETKGMKIMQDIYNQVYRDLEYVTRSKLKQDLDYYLRNPIRQINQQNSKLMEVCAHPFRKCLFLLTNVAKQDRTFQQYLKEMAFDFMNYYMIYEIDIDSNPELLKVIGARDKKAQLIVYNQRSGEYTKLGKKITKSLIHQFVKANIKNDKRLKKYDAAQLSQLQVKSIQRKEVKDQEEGPSEEL